MKGGYIAAGIVSGVVIFVFFASISEARGCWICTGIEGKTGRNYEEIRLTDSEDRRYVFFSDEGGRFYKYNLPPGVYTLEACNTSWTVTINENQVMNTGQIC